MFHYNKLVSVVCCLALLPVFWLWHGSAACAGPAVPHEGSVNTNITLQCTGCFPRDEATWYLEGGDDPVGTGTLTVPVTESSGGSIYRCECGSNVAMECHIILVNPYFIATFGPRGSTFVRSGDTFTLVCEANGFPRPELEDFTLTKTSPAPFIHFQRRELVPSGSGVALSVANASKERHSGQYRCIVNTEWSRGPMQMPLHGHNVTSATMTVYEPPFVRSTTNFTVGVILDGSVQPAATLECSVQRGDGEVTVQWARDGQVLQSSAKYVIADEPIREAGGVLVYLLTVRKLTEDDLGAYECQLFSNFSGSNSEAVSRVWIDSRNESKSSSTGSCDNIKYIIVIAILVVITIPLIITTVYAIYVARQYKKKGFYSRTPQTEPGMDEVSFNSHTGNGGPTGVTDPAEQEQREAANPYQPLPVPAPYALLPLAAAQTEEAENQEERLIPSTELSEQQPATEMDSLQMVSQSEDIVGQRTAMPATAQLENTDSSHGSMAEETAVVQSELSRALERPSESSAPTTQDPSPQSPRTSPKKSRRRSSQSGYAESSPRSSIPRVSARQTAEGKKEKDRRRSSSSFKDLVLPKRRGSERDDSQEPLAPHNDDARTSPSDSD